MYVKSRLDTIEIETITKVKSNVMDLICRTCLKQNLVRFNIFEYSQNARLVSDIIMELTSIKVSGNDELPVSICNKCLEKLISAYDFKQMVIQSNRELFQLRQSKIIEDEKELQPVDYKEIHLQEEFQLDHSKIIEVDNALQSADSIEICLKEETEVIKSEPIEFVPCLSSIDKITTEDLVVLSDGEDISIKQEDIEVDKELQSADSIEICLKEETEVIKSEPIEFVPCLSSIDEITTEGVVVLSDGEDISIKQEDMLKELDHLSGHDDQISISIDFNATTKHVTNLDKSDSKNIAPVVNSMMETKSDVCKTKKGKKKANYELLKKQVELVNNSDCKKIMESKLSRQEKNSATVYCQLCDRTLTYRYYIESHIHRHTGNLPFKCDECGLQLVSRNRLRKHMVSHAKTKEYTCEECGKAFAAKRQLKAHKVTHSNNRPYMCNICKKSFKFITKLRNHELCHSSRKKFICEKCGKSYFHKKDLIYHQRTHSKNKTVTCKTCGKRFLNKIALNDHLIKGHLTTQQLKCSSCGKEIVYKKLLTGQMLTGENVKPFSCKVCGKAYRQQGTLERHMRLHTEEAPYLCKLCKTNLPTTIPLKKTYEGT